MDVCQPMREAAKGILEREKSDNEKRAQALEVLIRVIPWSVLSKEDEELLWKYFAFRQ